METIRTYIDNMFKGLPDNEEIRKVKEEISVNMEDKYSELKAEGKSENEAIGIVISEFGNIDEIIKEFGIARGSDNKEENQYPMVELKDVEEYIESKKKTSLRISIGVAFCIMGIAILQFLDGMELLKDLPSNLQDTVMVGELLLMVAIGVGIFIYSGVRMEKYKSMEEGKIQLSSVVKSVIEERKNGLKGRKTLGIIAGVIICIMCPIPVLITDGYGDRGTAWGVLILLIMIAVAVAIFINIAGCDDGYNRLLREDDYSTEKKKDNKVIGVVASVVWPLAMAVFLVWSFVFHGWRISWIVFPVTGILFGIFSGVYSSLKEQ